MVWRCVAATEEYLVKERKMTLLYPVLLRHSFIHRPNPVAALTMFLKRPFEAKIKRRKHHSHKPYHDTFISVHTGTSVIIICLGVYIMTKLWLLAATRRSQKFNDETFFIYLDFLACFFFIYIHIFRTYVLPRSTSKP